MYLVHAHLDLPPGEQLPLDIRTLVRSAITADDGIEHVAVHPRRPRELTLGLYLLSDTLGEAEQRAVDVCGRLIREVPQLTSARLIGAGVPVQSLAFAPLPMD